MSVSTSSPEKGIPPAPSRELIAELKDAGVVAIASTGARRYAEKVAAWGADAVIVQGGEDGGHTGRARCGCVTAAR